MLAKLKELLLYLVLSALGVQAAPTVAGRNEGATPVERDLAPRGFQSGDNMTCYYKCPPNANNGATLSGQRLVNEQPSGALRLQCDYTGSGGTQTSGQCEYDNTGTLTASKNGYGSDNECPSRAVTGTCQARNQSPPGGQIRKRRNREPRDRTAAEEIIAARQYKARGRSREVKA